MKRTSKKQIHELEKHARETIDESARLYARYEYDASGNAYALINGTLTTYKSNTAMYDAVAEMILSADEPEQATEATEPEKIQVVGGNAIYRSADPATNEIVFTVAEHEFWTLAEARYFAQCNPTEATKEAINSDLETAIHANQDAESNEKAAKLAADDAEKAAAEGDAETAAAAAKFAEKRAQAAKLAANKAAEAADEADRVADAAGNNHITTKAKKALTYSERASRHADEAENAADRAKAAQISAARNAAAAALEEATHEMTAADLAESAASDAANEDNPEPAAEHAAEAEKHAQAAEKAAQKAAAIADEANDPEISSIADSANEAAFAARGQAESAKLTANLSAAEADKPAAERATLEAKQDASFASYEAYDARITAENTCNLATVEELAKKADEAAKKAEEAADKAESEARKADSARAATIAKIAREHAKKARHNARLAAMEAEERRKYYDTDLDEEAKADAAAVSFCAAYEEATGNPPYFEEAASVCRVAREEIAGQPIATDEDRETVAYMLEAIAIQAAEEAETAAAYAAFEANRREHIGEYLVKYEWSGEGLYRIAWSDGGQKSDPHHYESAEELAADLTSAYQRATETHQPYAERLEYYERHELLAYLGTPSDFDVSAIEAEATDTDEHGSRYWTATAEELEAIAQRNRR